MTKQEFQEIIKEKAEEQAYDCDAGLLHGYLEGADVAYDLLSDGWIEIKEGCEMPGENEFTLCYYSNQIFIDMYLSHLGKWDFSNVTHWMPLPQPPTKTKK